jgi:hypothetical protein
MPENRKGEDVGAVLAREDDRSAGRGRERRGYGRGHGGWNKRGARIPGGDHEKHRDADERAGCAAGYEHPVSSDVHRGTGISWGRSFGVRSSYRRQIWSRQRAMARARFVGVAAQVADETVFPSTIGLPPNGAGVLRALAASTGAVRWRVSTIKSTAT